MERDYLWHGKPPTKEEAEQIKKKLEAAGAKVTLK